MVEALLIGSKPGLQPPEFAFRQLTFCPSQHILGETTMRKESVVAGWTGKVLTGQIDRRSFMERLAALGLTGAAIGTLSSLIPDVAQAAGDPTTLLIATSETPPGLDTEYNASRSSHEGIAQTMDALVQFNKKVGDDGLLYCDFDNLKGALAESWEIDPDA